jgi:hypothetical protein
MPSEELVVVAAGVATAGYIAQQLFGKTLAEMGDDLNKVYKANRDKLLEKAARKVADPNDGAKPNLRVARDVIWNGAVTDDEVCAEYFGGLLAASRSVDGKDDSGLIYVDCIKALSSKQLHLHFIIYKSISQLIAKGGKKVNPGLQAEINAQEVWFATNQLVALGMNPAIDLSVLHRQGLLAAFTYDHRVEGDKMLPYVKAQPTTFGVLLFAAAMNSLASWKRFGEVDFPVSGDIALPPIFERTLDELCVTTGLVQKPEPTTPPRAANSS